VWPAAEFTTIYRCMIVRVTPICLQQIAKDAR
jgi:hypothetical protein